MRARVSRVAVGSVGMEHYVYYNFYPNTQTYTHTHNPKRACVLDTSGDDELTCTLQHKPVHTYAPENINPVCLCRAFAQTFIQLT